MPAGVYQLGHERLEAGVPNPVRTIEMVKFHIAATPVTTFRQLDPDVRVDWRAEEGSSVAADTIVCEIAGPARAILTGERNALNFLQTLSGTAMSRVPPGPNLRSGSTW